MNWKILKWIAYGFGIYLLFSIVFGIDLFAVLMGLIGRNVFNYNLPATSNKQTLKNYVDTGVSLSWSDRFGLWLNSLNPFRGGGWFDTATGGSGSNSQ